MSEAVAVVHRESRPVAAREMANAIRALSMDAVEKAKSGHPGMPMGMADVATVLFTRFLKFYAAKPEWPDRDRLVLSAGHGSMLLYALLYLTGYPGLDIESLRKFRQIGSNTPGHPEFGHTLGVETTTGPLGQGIANAVGMALAERLINERYGDDICNHFTYVIAGDGCLMEGISHEAISLAGHLKLGKLIVLFDDNHITIDGPTELAVSDDQLSRFEASGWEATRVDGHDLEAVAAAIEHARSSERPSLIACRTIIGYGAPNKQGSASTHGSPLGDVEISATRAALGWPHAPFEVPEAILASWRAVGARGRIAYDSWERTASKLDRHEYARLGDPIDNAVRGAIADAVRIFKAEFSTKGGSIATRVSSQKVLEKLAHVVPTLVGGSADLTGSNGTLARPQRSIRPDDFSGTYLHYGVREHAMAAAMNGMALHGGIVPYGGTFLVFADYCRPAIRLSALMRLRVVYVMTHDSIGLGEDGPTHQPVEHLASLRAMPNLNVLRPADAVECAECWEIALTSAATPSVICLSRQGLPLLREEHRDENLSARGGYLLRGAEHKRDVTLLATGSEVAIAIAAAGELAGEGLSAAVVSMPCWELFERQSQDYRDKVLGAAPRVAVEAACGLGWERWIGTRGAFIGMTGFGASAPASDLYQHFNITSNAVAQAARALIQTQGDSQWLG